MDVVLFYDLLTRDGRRAIEIRAIQHIEKMYYCPPRKTLYSCAYDTQLGRIIAFGRAISFCREDQLVILLFQDAATCSAIWQ